MVAITVVGSINLDLVVSAARLPVPGETVTDGTFATHPGGKGANQALAAQRLGADVTMVGRVGADENAEAALRLLREGGVHLGGVRVDPDSRTGVALIVVSADGENQIVVAPGANRCLAAEDVDIAADTDAVICQLEIPAEIVTEAANRTDAFFVLNAAPVRPLPDDTLNRCDLIVVNEVEHRELADQLKAVGGLVALTLGAEGAVLLKAGSEIARAQTPKVEVVDTVGAGDTFVAALTVGLAEGRPPEEALNRATAAGSLTATRAGAQTSLPTLDELDQILETM